MNIQAPLYYLTSGVQTHIMSMLGYTQEAPDVLADDLCRVIVDAQRECESETEDNISDGRIVQVTFRHIQDNRIICTFDSRLKAIVMLHKYSDGHCSYMKATY